jgi:hypothetical protein
MFQRNCTGVVSSQTLDLEAADDILYQIIGSAMNHIIFTASVIRKEKGSYVGHAENFSIPAQPASTKRGAIRKVKTAVLLLLLGAAEAGTLPDLLTDAGYSASPIDFLNNMNLEANIQDSQKVSVPLPSKKRAVHHPKKHRTGRTKHH